MGMSADAHLIYGYNLEGQGDWEIEQTGEYGEIALDWYDNEDGSDDDFVEACQKRLLASVGITENPDAGRYFDLEKHVEEHFGVKFFPYGYHDYGRWMLCAHEIEAYGWSVEAVDLADLVVMPEMNGWDDRLTRVAQILGVTPKQAKPAWLLTSSYG